jgi:adenine-specific DNA-methyltransferase
MSQKYEKLKTLLKELFQLDQPDLDFGLYRVMHAKSAEVSQFLDKDLLPQVKAAFGQYKSADKAEIEKELSKAVGQAQALGADPETLPKVIELRARLKSDAVDVGALESEVYDYLFSFFRRYYSEGDFLAKRVYKPGVYAIPYEGEEVTLHWANKDQYYIKTSEYLRDYAFRLRPDDDKKPMRVHFRLADAAEGEHGNAKAAEGKDRVFILASPGEPGRDFIVEEDGEQGKELVIRFEYRPATLTDWPDDVRTGKSKPPAQKDLTALAAKRVLAMADVSLAEWIADLGQPHVTTSGEKADYTRLEAHIKRYAARNTFDYFIHKDLGMFLRRELDFYIKNEVMHLDDVESETAPRVEQYLSKIKVIRKVAGKIIAFLAQLEDFQKKLWLKKKFVVETQYCITMDCIPEEFYAEIAGNEAQRKEWVKFFAIDKIEGNLTTPSYSVPLTPMFLKAHPTLVVDTVHLDLEMRNRLVAKLDPLHQQVTGSLIHSDNFQALRLVSATLARRFRFFYMDPPYNTESDEFLYKDNYRYSSWITMIENRLSLAHGLLDDDGSIAVSIDQNSIGLLRLILDDVFGRANLISTITVKRATVSGPKVINPGVVNVSDYVLLYAKDRRTWVGNSVYAERERDARYNLYVVQRNEDHGKWKFRSLLDVFAEEIGVEKGRLKSHLANQYEDRIHEFVKKNASSVAQLALVRPSEVSAEYRERLAESAAAPERVVYYPRPGFSDAYLLKGKVILFYSDKVRKVGQRLVTAERASDIWTDVLPNDVHNEGGVTFGTGKKPEALIARLVDLCSETDDLVGDFFLGSGTLGAVAQKMGRRWVGIEGAGFFHDVPLRRLRNVLRGDTRGISDAMNWHGGGISRYSVLETYEDTLNNLENRRTTTQQFLLDAADAQGADGLKEQYLLRYMLNVETRGSQSLLNIAAFTDPTAYKLKVKRPGSDESREVNVDLLETFNWLVGLTVRHIAAPQNFSAAFERNSEKRLCLKGRLKQNPDGPYWFRTVTGTTPEGRKTLIIWRKLTGEPEQDNLVLDEWFTKQGYSAKDSEFDLIYVNGGNNLENLKTPDDFWKVRLIEEDFHRLMFEMEGA